MRKFVKIVHDAFMAAKVSVGDLAELLDKGPSTIYGELNPHPSPTSTAKLGLEDAITICEFLGSRTLAEAIAEHFGLHASPAACDLPDKQSLEDECLDDYPALVAAHEAFRAGDADAGKARMMEHFAECRQTLSKAEQGRYDPKKDGPGQIVDGGKIRMVGKCS